MEEKKKKENGIVEIPEKGSGRKQYCVMIDGKCVGTVDEQAKATFTRVELLEVFMEFLTTTSHKYDENDKDDPFYVEKGRRYNYFHIACDILALDLGLYELFDRTPPEE